MHGLHARTVHTLDQHLDGAIGQAQQLQDAGIGAIAVQVVGLGVIHVRIALGDQHNALVGLHGGIERLDGLFAADEQRVDHMRINHHVAQRQHRHGGQFRGGIGHGRILG